MKKFKNYIFRIYKFLLYLLMIGIIIYVLFGPFPKIEKSFHLSQMKELVPFEEKISNKPTSLIKLQKTIRSTFLEEGLNIRSDGESFFVFDKALKKKVLIFGIKPHSGTFSDGSVYPKNSLFIYVDGVSWITPSNNYEAFKLDFQKQIELLNLKKKIERTYGFEIILSTDSRAEKHGFLMQTNIMSEPERVKASLRIFQNTLGVIPPFSVSTIQEAFLVSNVRDTTENVDRVGGFHSSGMVAIEIGQLVSTTFHEIGHEWHLRMSLFQRSRFDAIWRSFTGNEDVYARYHPGKKMNIDGVAQEYGLKNIYEDVATIIEAVLQPKELKKLLKRARKDSVLRDKIVFLTAISWDWKNQIPLRMMTQDEYSKRFHTYRWWGFADWTVKDGVLYYDVLFWKDLLKGNVTSKKVWYWKERASRVLIGNGYQTQSNKLKRMQTK